MLGLFYSSSRVLLGTLVSLKHDSNYCKFFLVDCWNGDDDEPVIYHGHTLTSKISFKDVIEAINEYAFSYSE